MKTINKTKKIALFVGVCVAVLLAAGCKNEAEAEADVDADERGSELSLQQNGKKIYPTKEGRFNLNETEFVRMYFSSESDFINSSIELIIENYTKGELDYGPDFSLEYFNKENWTKIQLNIAFSSILRFLPAGKTAKEKAYLFSSIEKYNNSKEGRYRLTKDFGFCSDSLFESDIISGIKLSTEFEIK